MSPHRTLFGRRGPPRARTAGLNRADRGTFRHRPVIRLDIGAIRDGHEAAFSVLSGAGTHRAFCLEMTVRAEIPRSPMNILVADDDEDVLSLIHIRCV